MLEAISESVRHAWQTVLLHTVYRLRNIRTSRKSPPAPRYDPEPAHASKPETEVAPDDEVYLTGSHWSARQLLERSECVMDLLGKRSLSRGENFACPPPYTELEKHLARLGAYMPHGEENTMTALTPADIRAYGLPALFMVCFAGDGLSAENELIPASAMSGIRLTRSPPGVELGARNEVVYQISAGYYDPFAPIPKYRRYMIWDRGFIAIDPATAQCRTLRYKVVRHQTIRHHRGGSSELASHAWTRASFGDRRAPAEEVFAIALKFWMNKEFHWQIQMMEPKTGNRLVTGISDKRIKQIFCKRDVFVRTPTGRRRPILHFVRAHTRRQKDGRRSPVRLHTRGETCFMWNGKVVEIVLPGKTATSMARFTAGAHGLDEIRADKHTRYVGPKELVRRLGRVHSPLSS